MTTGRVFFSRRGSHSSPSLRITASRSVSRIARWLFSNDEWPGGKETSPCARPIWRRMFNDIRVKDNFGLNYDPSHPVAAAAFRRLQAAAANFATSFSTFTPRMCSSTEPRTTIGGTLGLPKHFHQPRIPGFGELEWGRFMGAPHGQLATTDPVCIEVEDEDVREKSRRPETRHPKFARKCARTVLRLRQIPAGAIKSGSWRDGTGRPTLPRVFQT